MYDGMYCMLVVVYAGQAISHCRHSISYAAYELFRKSKQILHLKYSHLVNTIAV